MGSLTKLSGHRKTVSPPHATKSISQPLEMGPASRFLLPPCADPYHAIVEVVGTPFPPAINGGDLVCVDFTCNSLTCNSLYVIAINDALSQWIGIRRFNQTIAGEWLLFDGPDSAPRVMAYTDLMQIQVVGRVKDVFKSGGLAT